MNKFWMVGALGALLVSGAAHAGAYFGNGEVVVTGSSKLGQASGSPSAARESADDVQWIGCALSSDGSDPDEPVGICTAVDSAGVVIRCQATNNKQRKIIATIGSTSFIEFTVVGGRCGYVRVDNNSGYGPTP